MIWVQPTRYAKTAEQAARTVKTAEGEPRGRFGGVRGRQPLASSPPSANRTPNLARGKVRFAHFAAHAHSAR